MKRSYPLFIIDKQTTEGFPYHHIAVMADMPFVVRVRLLRDLADYTPVGMFYLHPLYQGAILFEVVSNNEHTRNQESLLKKAAKKYLLGYKDRNYKSKDLSLDNQIHQQELTVEHSKRNYTQLLERAGSKDLADFNIALAQATLESLYELKELKNNLK